MGIKINQNIVERLMIAYRQFTEHADSRNENVLQNQNGKMKLECDSNRPFESYPSYEMKEEENRPKITFDAIEFMKMCVSRNGIIKVNAIHFGHQIRFIYGHKDLW